MPKYLRRIIVITTNKGSSLHEETDTGDEWQRIPGGDESL